MHYDVVAIGGGTAGITAALTAARRGARTALVERMPRLGGECTFSGCVPSKALTEVARAAHDARRLLGLDADVDFAAVVARQARIVEEIAHDERDERFAAAGVELLRGEAAFAGPGEFRVAGETVLASRFVLATGSEPAVPPVPGLGDVPFLTNRTVFSLSRLPRRLIVLGGGAIGPELAQAFRRLGSEVTVVEAVDRLLPREEPEAGEVVERVLRREGIELLLGARATLAERSGQGVVLFVDGARLEGDALLVAAGRRGATDGLGLDRLGVAVVGGFVAVDDRCRTSAKGVYAAGDVTGGLLFTHVAAHEGRVAGTNAAGGRARVEGRVVPWVTFTDPEVARVGLTEEQARERHRGVETVLRPMARVDRARIEGATDGFVKLVTARRRLLGRIGGGELVGAQVVGPRAGELIHELALAMRTRAFAGRLAQTIHAYPSMSLALQQAASQLFPLGRALVEQDAPPGGPAVA